MDIKPIETVYKGYRFRSRLEARHAVFLEGLQMAWEYEPEGFETPAGWYLPDFRVVGPQGTVFWYEVKPEGWVGEDARVSEFNRMSFGRGEAGCSVLVGDPLAHLQRIARKDSDFSVCVRCGDLAPKLIYPPEYDPLDDPENERLTYSCATCDLVLGAGGREEEKPVLVGLGGAECSQHKGHSIVTCTSYYRARRTIRLAALAARQARFEHGETPR